MRKIVVKCGEPVMKNRVNDLWEKTGSCVRRRKIQMWQADLIITAWGDEGRGWRWKGHMESRLDLDTIPKGTQWSLVNASPPFDTLHDAQVAAEQWASEKAKYG